MPILYTVISRGNTILCKYADCVGNFSEVTESLISKIQLTNHKLTYTHGNYLFHYICADKLVSEMKNLFFVFNLYNLSLGESHDVVEMQ